MNAPPSAAVVRCAGDVSLRSCEAMHTALLNAIAAHEEVVLDCSEAEAVDASFIQLLLAARRSAQARGCRLNLSAPANGTLLDALVRGGLLDPDHPEASEAGPFWIAATREAR